jgi:hypothetical protein
VQAQIVFTLHEHCIWTYIMPLVSAKDSLNDT